MSRYRELHAKNLTRPSVRYDCSYVPVSKIFDIQYLIRSSTLLVPVPSFLWT